MCYGENSGLALKGLPVHYQFPIPLGAQVPGGSFLLIWPSLPPLSVFFDAHGVTMAAAFHLAGRNFIKSIMCAQALSVVCSNTTSFTWWWVHLLLLTLPVLYCRMPKYIAMSGWWNKSEDSPDVIIPLWEHCKYSISPNTIYYTAKPNSGRLNRILLSNYWRAQSVTTSKYSYTVLVVC